MSAVTTFNNQPAGTAVAGNQTFGVSIPAYRTAVLTAIPEPADFAAGGGGLALIAAYWRRRRRDHQCR